ncbi:SRPBCC family protein [Halococcus salsus]|uniref:SRPBCC family protein n=1 Tax=Halococcus salsus TaxID=2162894 RepID=UPI00135CA537|nr:SRPBCC family protein [Halococcus salsus]
MNFEYRARVDASTTDVFSFVADPRNDRQWNDRVVSVDGFDGGMAVGDRWTRVVRTGGGRSENVEECTRYEAPTTFGYRTVAGRTPVEVTCTLATCDGETAIVYTGSVAFRGVMRVLAPFVQGRIERGIESSVDRLVERFDTATADRTDAGVASEPAI